MVGLLKSRRLTDSSRIDTVQDCQQFFFNFEQPSVTVANRAEKFASDFPFSCRNLLQCAQFGVSLFLFFMYIVCFCTTHMLVNKRLSIGA